MSAVAPEFEVLIETVTLGVVVGCSGCSRRLRSVAILTGESVRTGNTTETAGYHLDAMRSRVVAAMRSRRWESTTKGFRCAHCTAADLDTLGGEEVL